MKYLRLKLINYIGIYNGMRLNEIEIDFTKAKSKIIMIKGDNGSGKSTLYNSLHPFPDNNEYLIPELPAEKQIDLQNGDDIYYIRIFHGINKKGERETTKVFMKKGSIYTNETEELNENGNVGSFKDILYNELNLDPNFLALTALSGNNRGLADMKPADRKKYVNAIIKDLVEYNDIYKTLSKRSSTFKSMINNISTKINSIGNNEQIKNTLTSIENRLNNLISEKDKLIESIAENKGVVKVLDPSGENVRMYDQLYRELDILISQRDGLVSKKDRLIKQINLDQTQSITEVYLKTKNRYTEILTDIQINENKIQSILEDKEKQSKEIEELNVKLYSYTSDINFDTLVKDIEKCKIEMQNYSDELSKRNTTNLLSLDEYDIILKLFDDINLSIYNMKDSYDIQSLSNVDVIDYNDDEYNRIQDKLSTTKETIIYYNSQLSILEALKLRPSECIIDTCGFIQDAIKALDKQPEEVLSTLYKEQEYLEQRLSILSSNKDISIEYSKYRNDIGIIMRTVNNYSSLLGKCNISISQDIIIDAINNSYNFYNEINYINQYKDTVNILTVYNKLNEEYNLLNNDYQIYMNKKELIDYMTNSLDKLQNELMQTISILDNVNTLLFELKQYKSATKIVLDTLEDILNITSEINIIDNNINDTNSKLYALQSNISKIKEYLNLIQTQNKDLEYVNNQIAPLIKDRDTLAYNIRMLEEYVNELEIFKQKYVKIEVLKKHSSPTKGIQLIFIELYMNSTLALANEMLSMLFEGEYILKPFVINENEFKIPCIGSGLGNDDISSMSTGQICMISMILSFSLLQQSSTMYNILKLDEIDGGLDTNNRRMFVSLLYKLINILKVEQTIMISHNNEIPMDEIDLIVLRTQDTSYINNNNIIYKF